MSQSNSMRTLAVWTVVAASLYFFVLCWLHAIGAPITNDTVTAADGAIVLSALLVAGMSDPQRAALPIAAIVLNYFALTIFAEATDLKTLRDALVIAAFLLLGMAAGGLASARSAFFTVALVAGLFGVFEAANPRLFGETFRILQFYVMRGVVDPGVAGFTDTSLFVSSLRGDERNLLPFLGPHRVSSIFLEPVSMGNFGAVAVAFALSLGAQHRRTALIVGIAGVLAILAADARFAATAVLLFAVARVIPLDLTRLILLPMPFVAVAVLLAADAAVAATGDDLPTRLARSGAAIAGLDMQALFGLRPPGRESLDSGYAYALAAFGLPFCVLAWFAFVLMPTPGRQSTQFKLLLGVYICALLCVSGSSLFALKTAALTWFLFGALIAEECAPALALRPSRSLQEVSA